MATDLQLWKRSIRVYIPVKTAAPTPRHCSLLYWTTSKWPRDNSGGNTAIHEQNSSVIQRDTERQQQLLVLIYQCSPGHTTNDAETQLQQSPRAVGQLCERLEMSHFNIKKEAFYWNPCVHKDCGQGRNSSAYKGVTWLFCHVFFLLSFYCIPVLVNQTCTAEVVKELWTDWG